MVGRQSDRMDVRERVGGAGDWAGGGWWLGGAVVRTLPW